MDKRLLADYLRTYHGRPLRLMEVCGTHTAALYRSGVRGLLSEKITLLAGPGCPVCVTPTAYIDKLVALARTPGVRVLSFGDMLAVPGSAVSLAGARAEGADVDFFYAPEQALALAERAPDTQFVLAAVGFETTAPVWAAVAEGILSRGLSNVRLLTALKTMPAAMDALCGAGGIDGFLCPGHVAVVTGAEAFRPLAEKWKKPMVVGGFTPELLLAALCRLTREAERGNAGVWNEYPAFVRAAGNEKARSAVSRVFEAGEALWRGLGQVPGSGLYLRGPYAALDAGSRGLSADRAPEGCRCGQVLTGAIGPWDCPLCGKACTPEHPVGACMVSGEGACRICLITGKE
ncbi:hydrogenase formation protein HypD [Agathobaculum sp. NTUH-O15-33]|uniref:hydrogenase formation protein HypD n=1 Tax=Agathobaculum sp. NTUH-O15-33 TaxID=3079302 RepID=UPI00295899EF|nr:hydrogenase formation protein HypD [Agathobaculum sp. NTUH-O15-33]WNX86262.1 hydrogenase formation protein HypD [Agathobaculum sp. NTUH-O15-33]